MYVAVRRYQTTPNAADELARHIGEGFVPIISQAPGFRDYYALNSGGDALTTISVFEDQAGAEESIRMAADYVSQNLAPLLPDPPEVITGGVIVEAHAPKAQLSLDKNKMLIQRFVEEVVNQRNVAVLDELADPSFTNHSLPTGPGLEGFKQGVAMFHTGFPDLRITLEDVIAEGDRVASRGTWRGTHGGEFMGVPPTGKQVAVSYIDTWRIESGKLVENWVDMDILGLLQQLGVVPQPAQTVV